MQPMSDIRARHAVRYDKAKNIDPLWQTGVDAK